MHSSGTVLIQIGKFMMYSLNLTNLRWNLFTIDGHRNICWRTQLHFEWEDFRSWIPSNGFVILPSGAIDLSFCALISLAWMAERSCLCVMPIFICWARHRAYFSFHFLLFYWKMRTKRSQCSWLSYIVFIFMKASVHVVRTILYEPVVKFIT